MNQTKLPDHPAAEAEYLHLQDTCATIDREIAEVEALTGAKAGECMDVQMKEDPDQQEEVTMQLFLAQLNRLHQLAMARRQAYFARLDFTETDRTQETYYLGRWGVLDPQTLDPVVIDWRSPVANLYYSGQIGPMDYEAPDGRVRGELTLKRMLTVRERELVSLFDSGIVSQEAYLQEVLGSVCTDRLREIVTTIQAEQNIVIRHGLNRHLIVQGAAGSGKTTIALHRIAYLLYTFQQTLRPESMMILAPNPLFLSYISQVLPDLGVERVIQTTFEGWCRSGMGKHMPKITRESRLEKNLSLPKEERDRTGSLVRRKGSLRMMAELSTWLEQLQTRILPENGFKLAGVVLLDRQELERIFLKDLRHFPLHVRIEELKKIFRKRLHNAATLLKEQYASMSEQQINRIISVTRDGPERRTQVRRIYDIRDQRYREIDERTGSYFQRHKDKFPSLDLTELYRTFLLECGDAELAAETTAALDRHEIRQEDLPILAMICRTVYGLKVKPLKHIIIDECQDYSPFQIELLRQANPAASFTLVGDLYQGIRPDEGIRSWEEWTSPVFHGDADFTQLTISYRNTTEIMGLARTVAQRYPIDGIGETKPVLRHGKEPDIFKTTNDKERLAAIRKQVHAWQDEGFHSIALIEKTAERAKRLYKAIGAETGAMLLTDTDPDYKAGVMILPASIAKGMEFDCVGICDASEENFPEDEFLSRILYVMMTRPLHRLTIWHTGELTPLLRDR